MKEKTENLGKVAITIEENYWDIKKPYDKLTVVEREGTGTTFISRKPVPPGTSILNRKYWIKFSKWSDIPYKITQKFGDSEELAISQKTLTNKFSEVETEIQEGDEALDERLRTIEVHERIMVNGGELEVATAEDLENPQTPRQEATVPTVRAILDASDDEPHLNSTKRFINSDNLAKMYGYYLDNLEVVEVKLDKDGRILEAIMLDGAKLLPAGVKVNGVIEHDGATITTIDNPEFVGECSNYLKVELDNNGRVLSCRKKNGRKVEYGGIDTPYIKAKKIDAEEISGYNKDNSLPDYYFENDYLDNKVISIRTAMSTLNGISFGFIIDPHIAKHLPSEVPSSTAGNAGYSPYLFKYIMDRLAIPFVLDGGDIPVVRADGWEEIIGSAIKWHEMMSVVGKERVFHTRGNHDYLGFTALNGNWAECGRSCTPKELYPIIMGDNHIYNVIAPERKMYYYFDVTNVNLRVIVLDDYGDKDTPAAISGGSCIGQSQYDWLINKALSCDNKNIILLSHQTADPELNAGEPDVDTNRSVLHEILKALVNKTHLSYTSTDSNGTVTVDKDFTNDTNVFVCHLSGHQHRDAYAKTDNVLSILQTCDCYSGYVPQGNYPGRTPGTITENAISIFSIDFDNRTIKMTRIGGGEDNVWTY